VTTRVGVVIVYHSVSGRTRALAEAAALGARAAATGEVVVHLLSADEATRAHALLAEADAIVFGCPTYMGSASAQFKAFMDSTSTVWALQGWRDKLAAGFTHSAAPSGDKLGTLTQLAVSAAQHAETEAAARRHSTSRSWAFPPAARVALGDGIERTNLRELVARPARFEHHLLVCATIDGVQLEVTTASEPLYFSHVNLSDEYALALPTGDELVDRFPLRTFLSDPVTGADVGRYNHRIGDVVLHPDGLLRWPGRLRAP
jgi:multimeric flavodoxin WrbA